MPTLRRTYTPDAHGSIKIVGDLETELSTRVVGHALFWCDYTFGYLGFRSVRMVMERVWIGVFAGALMVSAAFAGARSRSS